MLRIVQPSQSKDSCDSNPKATSKPPRKTLPKMCRQPDVGIAGRAFTASGSCKQQPNGSRNSSPRKNTERFSTYQNSYARNIVWVFSAPK